MLKRIEERAGKVAMYVFEERIIEKILLRAMIGAFAAEMLFWIIDALRILMGVE